MQSKHKSYILTESKQCVHAYDVVVGNFLCVNLPLCCEPIPRFCSAHVAGATNLPSDHASNAPKCNDPSCQVCSFAQHTESSVVTCGVDVREILDGKTNLPFLSHSAWNKIQSECADLHRTHTHLSEGTRPSRKLTNIRDIKTYLNVASIAHDGWLVVCKDQSLSLHKDQIIVPQHIIEGFLTAIHIQLDHPTAYTN